MIQNINIILKEKQIREENLRISAIKPNKLINNNAKIQ